MNSLQDSEEIVRLAEALADAQEAEIGRMRQACLDVKHTETLLSAYREVLRVAKERRQRLIERRGTA